MRCYAAAGVTGVHEDVEMRSRAVLIRMTDADRRERATSMASGPDADVLQEASKNLSNAIWILSNAALIAPRTEGDQCV